MKVFLYYIGKPRDPHANAMAEEYMRRSRRYGRCEMGEIKPGKTDPWSKHPTGRKLLLDPAGEALDSARFIGLVAKAERDGRDLVFVVGGADGLPAAWREKADRLLSLSSLTMPHELARVVLAEQIYRAFTALRGHPYPR